MVDLSELVAGASLPGTGTGIVLARSVGGEVEVATAGAVAEGESFELGSISKAVTGLLLADAVVRGEVTLETSLPELLPGAPDVTLGALADHTSGLPRVPWALLRRVGIRTTTDPYARTTIAELVDDALHAGRGGGRDAVALVDDLGDGRDGDTGLVRDIADGHTAGSRHQGRLTLETVIDNA